MPKQRKWVRTWQVVDKEDFQNTNRFTAVGYVNPGDIAEAKYQLARGAEITRRPVVLCEVTVQLISDIKPLSAEETRIECAKRERALRSGKRKLRL